MSAPTSLRAVLAIILGACAALLVSCTGITPGLPTDHDTTVSTEAHPDSTSTHSPDDASERLQSYLDGTLWRALALTEVMAGPQDGSPAPTAYYHCIAFGPDYTYTEYYTHDDEPISGVYTGEYSFDPTSGEVEFVPDSWIPSYTYFVFGDEDANPLLLLFGYVAADGILECGFKDPRVVEGEEYYVGMSHERIL